MTDISMKLRTSLDGTYRGLYAILAAVFSVNMSLNWPVVSLLRTKQPLNYGDLGVVLTAADCYRSMGAAVYKSLEEPCSYNYGRSLLHLLNVLRIGEGSTQWLGTCLVVLTVIAFVEFMRLLQPRPSIGFQLWCAVLFCSPPIMLLFERANVDTLVFCLAFVSVWLSLRFRLPFGPVVMAMAASFKFYPLPALLVRRRNLERTAYTRIFQLALTAATAALISVDLIKVYRVGSLPNPMRLSFGSPKIGYAIGLILHIGALEMSSLAQLIVGLGALVVGLLALESRARRRHSLLAQFKSEIRGLPDDRYLALYTLALLHVVAYFAGMNFMYRFVFIIPVLAWLYALDSPLRLVLCPLALLAAWALPWFVWSLPWHNVLGLVGLVGDVALFVVTLVMAWVLIPARPAAPV